jgi:hypothetical protein
MRSTLRRLWRSAFAVLFCLLSVLHHSWLNDNWFVSVASLYFHVLILLQVGIIQEHWFVHVDSWTSTTPCFTLTVCEVQESLISTSLVVRSIAPINLLCCLLILFESAMRRDVVRCMTLFSHSCGIWIPLAVSPVLSFIEIHIMPSLCRKLIVV